MYFVAYFPSESQTPFQLATSPTQWADLCKKHFSFLSYRKHPVNNLFPILLTDCFCLQAGKATGGSWYNSKSQKVEFHFQLCRCCIQDMYFKFFIFCRRKNMLLFFSKNRWKQNRIKEVVIYFGVQQHTYLQQMYIYSKHTMFKMTNVKVLFAQWERY